MNKPSERIVVFVSTAQKRAIAATAENLGISVSELMRRAVLSFGATSEQVKAASIVDRLRAPRAPDALNAALQRVARGTRHAKAALPAAGQPARKASESTAPKADSPSTSRADELLGTPAGGSAAPLLPAGVMAALTATAEEQEAAAAAEAVARVTAAKTASSAGPAPESTEAQTRNQLKRPRVNPVRDEDDQPGDPSTEGGRFA
jgi:hypothetical protein